MRPEIIAWNGISLDPEGRSPRLLDRETMVIGEADEAVQIRWRSVSGRFKYAKHIKKLGGFMVSDSESSSGVADGFRLIRFQVEDLEGTLLHHPGTGMTVEVQHGHEATGMDSLIASIRDHSGGKTVPWQAFGLSLRLSSRWLLESSTFRPGHFTLKFVQHRRKKTVPALPEKGMRTDATLRIERCAPADALLNGFPLHAWSAATWPDEIAESSSPPPEENSFTEARRPKGIARVLPGRRYRYGWVSRIDASNAIIAAFLHSRKACLEELKTVTEHYVLLQTQTA